MYCSTLLTCVLFILFFLLFIFVYFILVYLVPFKTTPYPHPQPPASPGMAHAYLPVSHTTAVCAFFLIALPCFPLLPPEQTGLV